MQTVLITGANGFIGYYLVEHLLRSSYNVIATGKGDNRLPFKESNFLYQPLDFTNAEEVQRVLKKFQLVITFSKPFIKIVL